MATIFFFEIDHFRMYDKRKEEHFPCKMAFGIPRNKGVNFHGKFGLGIPRNS